MTVHPADAHWRRILIGREVLAGRLDQARAVEQIRELQRISFTGLSRDTVAYLEVSRIEAEMLAAEMPGGVGDLFDEYAGHIEDPMSTLRLAIERDEEARRDAA